MPKLIVIDRILIPQRNPRLAVEHQVTTVMRDKMGGAGIRETPGNPLRQAGRPVRRSEQQGTRVRRDRPAREIRNNPASKNLSKSQLACATLRLHRVSDLAREFSFSNKNFRQFQSPMHPLV